MIAALPLDTTTTGAIVIVFAWLVYIITRDSIRLTQTSRELDDLFNRRP